MEGFFFDNHLVVQTTGSKKTDQATWKFPFELKKWYFVVITHEYHLLRKSEITLFIDGHVIDTKPLLFPKFDKVSHGSAS